MAISAEFMESLAADIGSCVYIEIAKWHLYLNDAHLHEPLAEKLAGVLAEDRLTQANVETVLGSFEVAVGGGRQTLPLLTLIPAQCQRELMDLLEERQRDL
ncbi:MAG: DUF3181 family protein [Synechococcales cyanobacterium RM1_1_8]|nr:DUF3181 family protein [Synechococcales cyanobacterium RM1_1_8]